MPGTAVTIPDINGKEEPPQLEAVAPIRKCHKGWGEPAVLLLRRGFQPRDHTRMIALAQDGPLTLVPILSSPATDAHSASEVT